MVRRECFGAIAAGILAVGLTYADPPKGTFIGPDHAKSPPRVTVPGPESDKLIKQCRGYVLTSKFAEGLIELPSLKQTPLQIEERHAHSLSGPDESNRVAFITDNFATGPRNKEQHYLRFMSLDGAKVTEVFARPGDAIWSKKVGESLALAPRGGNVAFVSDMKGVQLPLAYIMVGSLEIWNIDKKTGGKTSIEAPDHGLSWFPDGHRLAFVKLVDRDKVPTTCATPQSLDAAFPKWEKVPVVFVYDVKAATEQLVCLGRFPVVCSDGSSLLAMVDCDGAWKRVDLKTLKPEAVSFTGLSWARSKGGVIAYIAPDLVLASALPTDGTEQKWTINNSPLVGPKPMNSIKLSRINTREFQTIIPSIDPRTGVTFGFGAAANKNRDVTSPDRDK